MIKLIICIVIGILFYVVDKYDLPIGKFLEKYVFRGNK